MNFDPRYFAQLGQAISQAGAAQQRLTSELSSGSRVSSLSDDPLAAAETVGLQSSISGIDSFVQSSHGVQSRLQVADGALGEVVSQVNAALTVAVSAGNGTLSAANLSAAKAQVAGIRDSILALANTSYQGSYLFAGSQGAVKPFALDASTDPATTTYVGDAAIDSLTTPGGQQVQINLPGSSLFTAGSGSLLAALNQLVSDLSTGDTSAIQADSTSLTAALGVVSVQRSVLDSSLSRLTSATTYSASQATVLEARQSALTATDPAAVAAQLSSAETQYQALIGVEAATSKTDLFDLIH